MICPNKRHPDYQKLVRVFGEEEALGLFIANAEQIPTIAQAKAIFAQTHPDFESGAADSKSKLTPVTHKVLNDFLSKRGIDIVDFSREEALTLGKKWGLDKKSMVRGIADTCTGIIGLLEGTDHDAFGEEAGHMAYAMLKSGNPILAREMFNQIGKYAIFGKVLKDPLYVNNPIYRTKEGKLDIAAIKEEAIGKLLHEHLANESGQANKLQDFQRVLSGEDPEKVSKFQQWWNKALYWFKHIFNKYDDNPFKETAKQMLGTAKSEFKGSKKDLRPEGKSLLKVSGEDPKDFIDEHFDAIKQRNSELSINKGEYFHNNKAVRFKADDSELGIKLDSLKSISDKGRMDMKDILDRYINPDGTIKVSPDVKVSISNLDPETEKAYYRLQSNLVEMLNSFPVGTKFQHNINVYNGKTEADINGKAGRVDLLAISPDGKTHVINYEFISKEDSEVNSDNSLKHKNATRAYLKEIKSILKTGYGISDFGLSRTIPVRLGFDVGDKGWKYKEDSLQMSDGKASGEGSPYLRPIPTFDEKTADAGLNKFIDKFIALYDSKEAGSNSEIKRTTLDAISDVIQHIQLDLGVPKLNFQIEQSVDFATRATSNFVDRVRLLDPKDLSIDELAHDATALDMRQNDLLIYQDAYLFYKDKIKNATSEEQEELAKLKENSDKARLASYELNEARREFADFISRKWEVMGTLAPEKELSLYGRFLRPFNKPTTAVQTVFYRMKSESNREIEARIRPLVDRLTGIQDRMVAWQKATGTSYKDMLNMLKEKDSKGRRENKLIKQFKSEFYEQYEEHATSGEAEDMKWIRANVNMTALKEHLDKARQDAQVEINGRYPIEERNADATIKQEWTNETQANIKRFSLTDKKRGEYNLVQYGRRFPKDSWRSKDFEALHDKRNAPLKEYYDFIQEVNAMAAESGYIEWDQSKRFLPFIYKSMAESSINDGGYSIANSILRSLTVSDMDINYGQVDRFTNEKYESLPKFFTHDAKNVIIDKDGTKSVDHSMISEDLLANTALFVSKVVEYQENQRIEPLVKNLLWLEKNKDSLQTNHWGRIIEGCDPKHDNTKNYEAFKDIVSFQLYGKSYTNKEDVPFGKGNAGEGYNKLVEKVNKGVGFKLLSRVEEGGRYSLVKTIDAIKHFQMMKTLGFNMSVPLYRMLSTNIQSYIQAGRWYNHMELSKAELRHGAMQFNRNSANIHILMMKEFMPVEGQLHEEIRRMSMSKLTRDTLPDWMMMLTKRTHDWIQYVNYDAMMHNAIVIDGEVHNARDYVSRSPEYAARYDKNISFETRKTLEKGFEAKVAELVSKHSLIDKAKEVDGKLVIDGLDLASSSVTKYVGVIRNEGLKLSGNITKENEINARRNAFVRQFFMYKSWLPGMVESRFTALSYKEGEADYQWGRIRMVAKIASEGLLISVGRLTSMMRGTEKGIKHLSDLYDKKKFEYEDSTGQPFKMTRAAFYDMVRRGIQQEVKEIGSQIVLLSGVIAMYSAVKQADKSKKGALAFSARILDRSFEELNMYYNPTSLDHMINGSMLPALGFLTDLTKLTGSLFKYGMGEIEGDEKKKKGAHVLKYTVKNFPIVGQLPNWAGIVFPEYMKSLGYNPDAEQAHH